MKIQCYAIFEVEVGREERKRGRESEKELERNGENRKVEPGYKSQKEKKKN